MEHKELAQDLTGPDLKVVASAPYVYHCHHFNLFHDQTVEDALGSEESFRVRSRAARRSAWPMLSAATVATGASTPVERLQLASAIFSWMGHGNLELLANATGGEVRGDHLHYGFTWREKYGDRVRRRFPVDAFGSGFAAAATEVAFGLPPGSLNPSEDSCFACRDNSCNISLAPGDGSEEIDAVDRKVVEAEVGTPGHGKEESRIAEITRGLNGFLEGITGDERGLVQGFGIYVTRHLSGYYDHTAYESIHLIERQAPQAVQAVEELFGESGHVCVFYTFGNLLLSPEWEGMVGKVKGDVEEVVSACVAIARGLGFGHWTIEELAPGQRLVLRSTSNYEFPFYRKTYGKSDKPRCYFFANAARAMMQLAHRVDWPSQPTLNEELYQSLFKQGLQWRIEETSCCAKGDDHCEVVVSKAD